MSHGLLVHVFFGLLAALGIGLLVSGQSSAPRGQAAERMESFLGRKGQRELIVSDLPPLAQRFLAAPLTDLGQTVFRRADHEAIEDRLRRSGWRYASVGDYHASRLANALAFGAAATVAGIALEWSLPLTGAAAIGLAALGAYMPDQALRKVMDERRQALFREMAWTLDRIAIVMRTGEALEPTLNRLTNADLAWVAGGSGGLFIASLRDIAAGMSTHRHDVDEMLADLRRRLPADMPEVDEFMQAIQLHIEKRRSIVEQLRALGRTMRDGLNNRIDEVAQKAELQVVAMTSGVIVPCLLFVVGGAAILGFMRTF